MVYFEKYLSCIDAIKREQQIKKWSRAKKEALIVGDDLKLKSLSKRRK